MINAVIFDWGGVLIEDPTKKLISIFAEILKINKKELIPLYSKYKDAFQRGKLSEDEYWKNICNYFNINEPSIGSLWRYALRFSYKENKDVFSLASSLKKNRYKIGILSNTEPPSIEFFLEQNYKIFDTIIFSCKEGYRKPEREIYEIAISNLNLSPEESVFIDDKKENLDGAQKIGIKTILFKNYIQLIYELKLISIKLNFL